LGLESKKQSGLALPCGIYRCAITAFRIPCQPITNKLRPVWENARAGQREIIAVHVSVLRNIECILAQPPTMMFAPNRSVIPGSADVSSAGWNCLSQCGKPAGRRRSQEVEEMWQCQGVLRNNPDCGLTLKSPLLD
jgi:hypothetical protein